MIGSPEDFVATRWEGAAAAIDKAFKRWRTLYRSANEERREAAAIGDRPGLSTQERKDARMRYNAADKQVELLAKGVRRRAHKEHTGFDIDTIIGERIRRN